MLESCNPSHHELCFLQRDLAGAVSCGLTSRPGRPHRALEIEHLEVLSVSGDFILELKSFDQYEYFAHAMLSL